MDRTTQTADDPAAAAARVLYEAVERHAPASARAWFTCTVDSLRTRFDKSALLAAYAGAPRRLRGSSVSMLEEPLDLLRRAGLHGAGSWSLERMARAALLVAGLPATDRSAREALVREIFRTGDNGEREALLAALLLLPDCERFVVTAIDACRTNVVTVFEAIACYNEYPLRYFPDPSFNQMILKALFLGVPLVGVVGLSGRLNAELVRMAADYASERRAAGRSVPEDIGLIVNQRGHDA